jgi:signal transduction histidine kinase
MTTTFLPVNAPLAPTKGWDVLVIDDDERWRGFIADYLGQSGHRVRTAPDGAAGLALAAERPDVILCDIVMPGLDGYAVLEALHQRPALREIPFIFLTGRVDRADQRRGMVLGAADYLTKPFKPGELTDAIRAAIAKRTEPVGELRRHAEERRRELQAPWGHELLTPLNGILGAAFLLESEHQKIDRGEVRELAASIRQSAERQLALAHKLLQHFQLGRFTETGWSEPDAMMNAGTGAEDEARLAVKRAGRSADLRVDCVPAAVRISPDWLRAAVGELVENACKFSPAGTPVSVTGRVTGGVYRLEIIDHGPGMSAEECAGIAAFRQFGRDKHEQQGLGLGLSIAQAIARLHHGTLTLGAAPAGPGLRVVLDLPLVD